MPLFFVSETPREIGSEFVYYETHYVGVLVISGGIGKHDRFKNSLTLLKFC